MHCKVSDYYHYNGELHWFPSRWNKLPKGIKCLTSLGSLRHSLKKTIFNNLEILSHGHLLVKNQFALNN